MQRQITVYESAKNGKVTVLENVEANTLGELKPLLAAKGIDYTNMDFMEGVSNTILRDDTSALPTNVSYKGRTTNDLFIYLSLKNKKIASGADRRSLMAFIREHNLGDEVKRRFGRNYTQVCTEDLEAVVAFHQNVQADAPKPCSHKNDNTEAALRNLVHILVSYGTIDEYDKEEILDVLDGKKKEEAKSVFSNDEIEDFISRT